jgi:putative ABC transport system permease protein
MSKLLADILCLCRIFVARWAVYGLMIAGLALAYGAAIIIGLYVRDELTYDCFIPHVDQVYVVSAKYGPLGQAIIDSDRTPAGLARWIRSDVPEVAQVARLDTQEWPMQSARLRVKARFYFADANLFEVLPLPVLHGNPGTALAKPGSVVLTRRLAVAYFGRDDVVGQRLTANNLYTLTVTAVLKDLPANTHLDREMFVAGNAPYAKLYAYDHDGDYLWANTYTYFTLKPGATVAGLGTRFRDISRRHWQGPNNLPDAYEAIRLGDLHFRPHGDGEMKPRGHLDSLYALSGIAVAILALACINFSGLVFAERNERIAERALYRALGARRIDLAAQIVREAVAVNGVSAFLGLVIVERVLPVINATLGLGLSLWAHPISVLLAIGVATVTLSLAGCIVPAVIVSRPRAVERKLKSGAEAASMPWRGWVIAQLVLVIVMLCAAQTMARQWTYSTTEALGFNGDNVVMVKFCEDPQINAAFSRDVASLPGVEAAAPSWGAPTNDYVRPAWIRQPGRPLIALTRNSVDPAFFNVFGVRLMAGRRLSGTFVAPETPGTVLINLAAARALGFATPQAAVGTEIEYYTDQTVMHSKVAGVVSNLRISTVYEPMQPMIFDNYAKYFNLVSVRLSPDHPDETLRRIDDLWRRDSAGSIPIERWFFKDYLMVQYHDLRQQITAFYIISSLAILLSTLGLTGLSIFLTRHQMQEMAIRRALGATFGDIFRQRFVPFIGPFLMANLIAWPVAWFSMASWLGAFADRVPLPWLSFVGAGLVSVLFGLLTIAIHSIVTLRDVRISSLRSE